METNPAKAELIKNIIFVVCSVFLAIYFSIRLFTVKEGYEAPFVLVGLAGAGLFGRKVYQELKSKKPTSVE